MDLLSFTGIYAVTKGDKYAYSLAMELQLLGISVETGMLGCPQGNWIGSVKKRSSIPATSGGSIGLWIGWKPDRSCRKRSGKKRWRSSEKKHPAFAYGINRNPLLRILDLCPKRLQLFAIRQVLKQEK